MSRRDIQGNRLTAAEWPVLPGPAAERSAALTICDLARDKDDAVQLLDACGLLRGKGVE